MKLPKMVANIGPGAYCRGVTFHGAVSIHPTARVHDCIFYGTRRRGPKWWHRMVCWYRWRRAD